MPLLLYVALVALFLQFSNAAVLSKVSTSPVCPPDEPCYEATTFSFTVPTLADYYEIDDHASNISITLSKSHMRFDFEVSFVGTVYNQHEEYQQDIWCGIRDSGNKCSKKRKICCNHDFWVRHPHNDARPAGAYCLMNGEPYYNIFRVESSKYYDKVGIKVQSRFANASLSVDTDTNYAALGSDVITYMALEAPFSRLLDITPVYYILFQASNLTANMTVLPSNTTWFLMNSVHFRTSGLNVTEDEWIAKILHPSNTLGYCSSSHSVLPKGTSGSTDQYSSYRYRTLASFEPKVILDPVELSSRIDPRINKQFHSIHVGLPLSTGSSVVDVVVKNG